MRILFLCVWAEHANLFWEPYYRTENLFRNEFGKNGIKKGKRMVSGSWNEKGDLQKFQELKNIELFKER